MNKGAPTSHRHHSLMTIPEAAGLPGASRGGRGLWRHTAAMNYVLPHVSSNSSTGESRYRIWSIQNMNKWTAELKHIFKIGVTIVHGCHTFKSCTILAHYFC